MRSILRESNNPAATHRPLNECDGICVNLRHLRATCDGRWCDGICVHLCDLWLRCVRGTIQHPPKGNRRPARRQPTIDEALEVVVHVVWFPGCRTRCPNRVCRPVDVSRQHQTSPSGPFPSNTPTINAPNTLLPQADSVTGTESVPAAILAACRRAACGQNCSR